MDGYRIEALGPNTWEAFALLYERLGFDHLRPRGKGNCVMTVTVEATG